MSISVKQRKGTTAQHSTFAGAEAEITVDTVKHTAVVHDGLKQGGYPLQKEPIVTTWANKPVGSTLTPYVDRIFVTDAPNIGEWYWDGSAYVKDSDIITDYGSITGAANAPTTGYNGFASNLQVVASWANMPSLASVTPYVDRVFCIGVGVGGSEWYSDGTRWRAVGGGVVLTNSATGAVSINATAMSSATKSISFIIPTGLIQSQDQIIVETNISKTGTAGTANIDLSISNGTSESYVSIARGGTQISTASNTYSHGLTKVRFVSNTQVRADTINANVGQGTPNALVTITNISTNPIAIGIYLTVTNSSDSIIVSEWQVTLKTCG